MNLESCKISQKSLKENNIFSKLAYTFIDLVIAPRGSDFCDVCVKQTNVIDQPSDEGFDEAHRNLETHHMHTAQEYLCYHRISKRQNSRPCNGTIHLIFDFTEYALQLLMNRQPRNQNIVTGLKLDQFLYLI